ncbi:MAG: TIGR04283 family arsenosugar biosynthesis glycosyltransferase [Verrucomicrobia bacterium]|nr:TIGR04283 family arsenosugar biosynthesis glycosyltransferase [Verrucomicrobiota bacterium]
MENPTARRILVVFTRYPLPGRAKTRLIPLLGAGPAASLQRKMTEQTVHVARCLSARKGVRVEIRFDGASTRAMRHWLGSGLRLRSQGEGDLGQRIARGFDTAFASGNQQVVVIGTDSPELDPSLLAQAFGALEQSDLVLGPARDGGYYLIGLNRSAPGLFGGIPWGTEQVLSATLSCAARLGLRHALLPALDDVDRPTDLPVWERVRRRASTLAVIIPTLNEAAHLAATLKPVLEEHPEEVIVVDGGSQDRTVELARASGVQVISAPRGRGRQLNAGAQAASAAQLLFLHADTLPPAGYRELVGRTLDHPKTVAGAFAFSIRDPMRHRRLVEWWVAARGRILRNPFGDQGLFVRRDLFEAVDGYPDWPLLEDVEILRRLRPHGRLAITTTAASTSGRRWLARGVWSTLCLNLRIMLGYYRGIPIEQLARLYASPPRRL